LLNPIAANEFNLNLSRYIDTFQEEEEIDLSVVQEEIRRIEEKLSNVQKELRHYLNELNL